MTLIFCKLIYHNAVMSKFSNFIDFLLCDVKTRIKIPLFFSVERDIKQKLPLGLLKA